MVRDEGDDVRLPADDVLDTEGRDAVVAQQEGAIPAEELSPEGGALKHHVEARLVVPRGGAVIDDEAARQVLRRHVLEPHPLRALVRLGDRDRLRAVPAEDGDDFRPFVVHEARGLERHLEDARRRHRRDLSRDVEGAVDSGVWSIGPACGDP